VWHRDFKNGFDVRRIRRFIFNSLTGLSLVLWVAVMVLWVRSCRNRNDWTEFHDWIGFRALGRSFEVATVNHALRVEWTDRPYAFILAPWVTDERQSFLEFIRPQHSVLPNYQVSEYRWLGFYFEPSYHQSPGNVNWDCWFTAIGFPYYFLFFVTGLPTGLWIKRWMKKRRRKRLNLCSSCSYNLVGNISGTCPECGTVISTRALT
jgi:hypothetical protein